MLARLTNNLDSKQKQPTPRYIAAVYARPRLAYVLGLLSNVFVIFSVLGFIGTIIYLALKSTLGAVMFAVLCAVPFLAVTLLRVWINADRPYEVYDFENIKLPKQQKGRSMPSRHVFSAFVIGTIGCFVHLPLGIAVLSFGVCISALRILLGIHFLRDVTVGALIGIVSGLFGGIAINYFLG